MIHTCPGTEFVPVCPGCQEQRALGAEKLLREAQKTIESQRMELRRLALKEISAIGQTQRPPITKETK